jgi:hypothetical protein
MATDNLSEALAIANELVVALERLRKEHEAMRERVPDLVGPGEIAELLQIRPESFSRLKKQGRIPPPIAELKDGPVWLRAQFTFPNTLGEAV